MKQTQYLYNKYHEKHLELDNCRKTWRNHYEAQEISLREYREYLAIIKLKIDLIIEFKNNLFLLDETIKTMSNPIETFDEKNIVNQAEYKRLEDAFCVEDI